MKRVLAVKELSSVACALSRGGRSTGRSRSAGQALCLAMGSLLVGATANAWAQADAGGAAEDRGASPDTLTGPMGQEMIMDGAAAPDPEFASPVVESAPVVPEAIPGDDTDIGELDLAALLDKVVVTATRSAMREDQAPAITTVISREEIQQWGYQSVEEVLQHVAGVYVTNDHIIPNLAVRGISGGLRSESGLVKVMIDGRTVAFRSTAGNWLGPELVPLTVLGERGAFRLSQADRGLRQPGPQPHGFQRERSGLRGLAFQLQQRGLSGPGGQRWHQQRYPISAPARGQRSLLRERAAFEHEQRSERGRAVRAAGLRSGGRQHSVEGLASAGQEGNLPDARGAQPDQPPPCGPGVQRDRLLAAGADRLLAHGPGILDDKVTHHPPAEGAHPWGRQVTLPLMSHLALCGPLLF